MSNPDEPKSSKARSTRKLNEFLEERLLPYAVVAATAGVNMLALTPAAQAEIIYTPAHQAATGGILLLDINNDGITDFQILVNSAFPAKGRKKAPSGYYVFFSEGIEALNQNRFELNQSGWAAALSRGQEIGKADVFQSGYAPMLSGGFYVSAKPIHGCTSGPWAGVRRKFMGLEISIDGEMHYGWARLTVAAQCGLLTTRLTGYAYETEPGKEIRAGQTSDSDESSQNEPQPESSLGGLALGALRPGARWKSTATGQ